MPVGVGQGAARGMMQGREAFMAAQEAQQREQLFKLKMQQFQQAQAEEQRKQAALAQLSQDPRFAGMGGLLQVDPAAAIKQAYPEAKVVAPGASLVAPNKPDSPLFTAPDKQATPASIREYEYAKGQGYKGTFQDFALEQKKAGATQVTQTVGAKEADKKFAEDYVAFATGGFADTQKQINQLKEVSAALATKEGLTGPVVGNIPRSVRNVSNPESVATTEAVEEVVQRNLRLILGAQFTEKEGERLISRAYNPALPQAENKKRVDRLIAQIQSAAEAKLDASRYFMTHGTLDGWRGKLWKMEDFNPEKDAPAQKVKRYNPATGRIE